MTQVKNIRKNGNDFECRDSMNKESYVDKMESYLLSMSNVNYQI